MAPGYEAKDEARAPLPMKLLKSLHCLKQSLKNWHGIIDTFLVGIGFKGLKSDPYVYIVNETTTVKLGLATDDDSTVILTLYQYVNDVLLVGGNKTTLEMLKGKLMRRFQTSDVDELSRISGCKSDVISKPDWSSPRRTMPRGCSRSTACKTAGRWRCRGTARSCP